MAEIKEGYNGLPLTIKVNVNDGRAEIWTDMFDEWKYSETDTGQDKSDPKFRTEVLHYASLTELVELRNELNKAIRTMAGV